MSCDYYMNNNLYSPICIILKEKILSDGVYKSRIECIIDIINKLKGDLTNDLSNLASSISRETDARLPELVDTITSGAKTIAHLTSSVIESASNGIS